jgi:hypothetical protein
MSHNMYACKREHIAPNIDRAEELTALTLIGAPKTVGTVQEIFEDGMGMARFKISSGMADS